MGTMLDTLCTLPLSSDLFAQAIHPSAPLVAVGLSSGHVQCLRLPPVTGDNDESNDAASASENGYGQVETAWRTRRHKGSCRTLGFSFTGDALYSSGTDGVVKAASVETGKVFSKIAVPDDPYVHLRCHCRDDRLRNSQSHRWHRPTNFAPRPQPADSPPGDGLISSPPL